jgi:hypothetical protein
LAASSRTRIDQRSRGHGLRNDTGLDEEFLHPIDAVDRYRQGRIDLFVVDRLIGDEFSTLVVRLGVRHVMGDLDRLVAMKQYQLKAKPTAMGGPAANLTAVMSGQIDVGWAAAPFGLDQLDQNRSASLRPATMPTPSRVRRCELMPTISEGAQGRGRSLHESLPRSRQLHVHRSERTEGLCALAQDQRGQGQTHAR